MKVSALQGTHSNSLTYQYILVFERSDATSHVSLAIHDSGAVWRQKWLPSDETAMKLYRYMYYTLYGQDPG
jgi:hypothetical protein